MRRFGFAARTLSRCGLFGLLASIGVILPAGSVLAGGGSGGLVYPSLLTGVSDAGGDESQGRRALDIPCPKSHPEPTGGGVAIDGDQRNLNLEVASTTVTDSGWHVEVDNSSGFFAKIKGTAVCAKKGKYTHPFVTAAIPSRGQAQAQVSCPKGAKLVGGGVDTSGTSFKVEVASSEPADGKDRGQKLNDGWLGRANNGTLTGQTMVVQAVCSRFGKYRYVQSDRSPVRDNSAASQEALCPKGTSVTGGGIDISGADLGVEVANSFPTSAAGGANPSAGWLGTANNDDTGSPQTMQAFAICRRG